jgi:hypothetical protein
LPVAVVMAGGYARKVDEIVDNHIQTVRVTLESLGQHTPPETR